MLWREIQHGCSCKPKIFVESKTSADCRAFKKEEKAFGKEKVSEEADMGQRNLASIFTSDAPDPDLPLVFLRYLLKSVRIELYRVFTLATGSLHCSATLFQQLAFLLTSLKSFDDLS